MNRSETISSLAKALTGFNAEVSKISKDANNPFLGNEFGNWTVIGGRIGRSILCQCKCGNIKMIYITNLTQGKSKSCGCTRQNGLVETKLYNVWASMKSRCFNQNHKFYKDYGGRGITVCEEWRNSIIAFYEWAINNGYNEGLTLDRIDNNKSYSPSNCRWTSRLEQLNNRRNNLRITHNGVSRTVAEWSRETGINNRTILSRVRAGWEYKNLFIPTRKKVCQL
jgi:hypothetical protein